MAKAAKPVTKKPATKITKAKAITKQSVAKLSRKRVVVPPGLGKIRIGIIHGKNFDPIKVGTQDRDYPEHLKLKNNTGPKAEGWGGMYHADVSTGLKMQRLHPDIFEIDFMMQDQATEQRLAKNHLTLNFWGDISIALMADNLPLAKRFRKIQMNAEKFHHYPAWDYYEWVLHKSRYMKQCQKAGIPMIPTIFVDNGFDAKKVLQEIQKKGWDKFFCKPAYMTCFGAGVIHGKTQDFVNDSKPFLEYEKENRDKKEFLVQPYMLKPNGDVFDEIRNFFIDGEWCYSVYTDGTDDEGFWEQPAGPLKEACKALATRAAAEAQKVSLWEGKQCNTLLNRIDIGIIPDKSQKLGYRIFLNEIEPHMTTWLGRYCPFDIVNKMGDACVKKTRQLLKLSLDRKRAMPNADKIKKLLDVLDQRLGPL